MFYCQVRCAEEEESEGVDALSDEEELSEDMTARTSGMTEMLSQQYAPRSCRGSLKLNYVGSAVCLKNEKKKFCPCDETC